MYLANAAGTYVIDSNSCSGFYACYKIFGEQSTH